MISICLSQFFINIFDNTNFNSDNTSIFLENNQLKLS